MVYFSIIMVVYFSITIYNLHEGQVFHGYDSLDFKPDEILAWSTSQFYVQIKDRYYFPDGSEWTTDDGDC